MYQKNIHHRRSIRLKGYDYAQSGAYFITICCQDRAHRFGQIENGEMVLNQYGEIAYNEWVRLSERYPHAMFDVFQIMPNHFHAIIVIDNDSVPTVSAAPAVPTVPVGAGLAPAPNETNTNINIETNIETIIRAGASPAPTTIGHITGAYKSLVTNACLAIYKQNNETMGKLWQRNYYEHIIRNEQSYQRIAAYIINNPMKWQKDKSRTP